MWPSSGASTPMSRAFSVRPSITTLIVLPHGPRPLAPGLDRLHGDMIRRRDERERAIKWNDEGDFGVVDAFAGDIAACADASRQQNRKQKDGS